MDQISLFDHPDLIGTASFSAKLCPVAFANSNHALTESSYDSLDHYEFFGFKFEGARIGLRKHRGNQTEWCYVSLQDYAGINPISFLATSLSLPKSEIVLLDEPY